MFGRLRGLTPEERNRIEALTAAISTRCCTSRSRD
jgi:hypothetical protein